MSITLLNQEGIVYGTEVEMSTVICYKCAIPFAMPNRLKEYLKRSQDTFYCPNGHSQAYTKSTETILRERMEKQRQDYEMKVQLATEQRDRAIKERTALKGNLTKVKNRIKNGVCPCCNRSFTNLANHMKYQHPEFNAE